MHHYINGIISTESVSKAMQRLLQQVQESHASKAGASYKGDDNLVISTARDAHANGSIGNHELY